MVKSTNYEAPNYTIFTFLYAWIIYCWWKLLSDIADEGTIHINSFDWYFTQRTSIYDEHDIIYRKTQLHTWQIYLSTEHKCLSVLWSMLHNQPTRWSTVHLEELRVEKFLTFLWNPKVLYCVHKSLPLGPILSQMNPTYYMLTMH
jgi:hypothetical protein